MTAQLALDLPEPAPVARARRPAPVDPGRTTYDDRDRWTYLGAPEPSWLARAEFGGHRPIPLMVSHRRLRRLRRKLPRAVTPWFLDSGGFTELSTYGTWTVPETVYAAAVRRYYDEIGELEWCAPQDWMCEPNILAKTGLSVGDHQVRTVSSYLNLMWADGDLPWIPVLQGWTLEDYLRCIDLYAAVGINLRDEPLVGLGTVCRRQDTPEAVTIIRTLHDLGLRLHGFGFKITGLRAAHHLLYTSDSQAWSADARRNPPMDGCTHATCNYCPKYAIAWRNRLLASLPEWQQDTVDLVA